jgi:hypothetical protein
MRWCAIGTVTQCAYHGETYAAHINWHEFHVKCLDCSYGAWMGQSKENALAARNRHNARHSEHHVGLAFDLVTWDGGGTMLRDDLAGKPKRRPPDTQDFPRKIRVDIAPPF